MGPVSTKTLQQDLKAVPKICAAFNHFIATHDYDYSLISPPDHFDYAKFSTQVIKDYYLVNPDFLRSHQSIVLMRLLDDAMLLAENGYDYTKLAVYVKLFAEAVSGFSASDDNQVDLSDHLEAITVLHLDDKFRADRRNQVEILFLLELLFLLTKDQVPAGYLVPPLTNNWTQQKDNAKLNRELMRAYALSLVPKFYHDGVDCFDSFFHFAQSHRLALETRYILFYYSNHSDSTFLRNVSLVDGQKKELLDSLPLVSRKAAEVIIEVCA